MARAMIGFFKLLCPGSQGHFHKSTDESVHYIHRASTPHYALPFSLDFPWAVASQSLNCSYIPPSSWVGSLAMAVGYEDYFL
jgi:hypothetical protein